MIWFFAVLVSLCMAVGTSSIAKNPSNTYQKTNGFATWFSDSSFFCSEFNGKTNSGFYFAINGAVGYPSSDFKSKFCGKCIAVQGNDGKIISPVKLIDVCDPSNCDYSDVGHIDILNNNGNKAYNQIENAGGATYDGNPKLKWWWLPSCDADPNGSPQASSPPPSKPNTPPPTKPSTPPPTKPNPPPCSASYDRATVPSSGSYDLEVSYSAPYTAFVIADLLDTQQWGNYASGRVLVQQGSGTVKISLQTTSAPPTDKPLVLSVWIVDQTKVDSPEPWTLACTTVQHPVTLQSSNNNPPPKAPKSNSPPPSKPSTPPPTKPDDSGSCSDWKTGTMSGYDNLDGGDDMHPGCVAEHCGTTDGFLNANPMVSILSRDFPTYKYHWIEINYNGKVGRVQVWDECVNADCPDHTDCCTDNAKKFGGDFLLDVDKHALKNLFSINNYEDVLNKVTYRICEKFDSTTIANKWFGKGNREAEDSAQPSGMPAWGWGLVAVGAVLLVAVLIGGAILYMKKRQAHSHETV